MKYLMHFCTNWGRQGCRPDVEEHRYEKEVKNGEEIPLMPVGKKQERLDEMFKNCKERYFVAEEKICPICDSVNIESKVFDGISKKDITQRLKCYDCKEIF